MALDIQITDQDLPVLSAVATQALELLQDPLVTNNRIEELIRQDVALTERLLRTANSPFYAGRNQSSTIAQAILRLGLRQLRNVIIVAATGELFSDHSPVIQALWEHALATAVAANKLADRLHLSHGEEAFIGGMLHDVGKLIIYRQHPEVYGQTMEESKATGRCLEELEVEKFQYFTHTTVGGLVVRKWRLADAIAEAARFHHTLERTIPDNLQSLKMACLVSVANVLVQNPEVAFADADWERVLALECTRELGASRAHLQAVRAEVTELAAKQPLALG